MSGLRAAAHPLAFITIKCAAPTVTAPGLVRMLLHTKMACYNNQGLFHTHIICVLSTGEVSRNAEQNCSIQLYSLYYFDMIIEVILHF